MTDHLPSLEAADFAAFFRGVYGHDPFPWQTRLAKHLAASGQWPSLLDLPTGTGKTAVIDIAVFHLALQAGRRPAPPRRIVYVVDRRTIVDQAYERAATLIEAIESSATPILAAVNRRLASYGVDGVPIRTALMRGGIARDDLWARTPDQPLVLVSTVDQVGSRLLFRGYGVSETMRSIHAGLLGNDVLLLLDEVHLSGPFRATLAAIGSRFRRWADQPLDVPFAVVEMSATPAAAREGVFTLDPEDRTHPVLTKRLGASKPTRLIPSTTKRLTTDVRAQVEALVATGCTTIAVVVNRVATAREVHRDLTFSIPAAEVELITGRMRPLDRDAVERRLQPRIRAGRERGGEEQLLVVVATQCIEAGADFDFDGLVTECASLDALRQRFGRLDRLGSLAGAAKGVIVTRTDALGDDPVYGDAALKTWEWLQRLEGPIDFGNSGVEVPLNGRDLGLLSPAKEAPVLLPGHLDIWAQTFPTPVPDPDVAFWLHGPEPGPADVQVIWRADLSRELLEAAASGDARAAEVALGAVECLPPASAEAMAVPFLAVRRWLERAPEASVFDVEGASAAEEDDHAGFDLLGPVLVWRGDSSRVAGPKGLRPGDTIVVPVGYGGVKASCWDPSATEPVTDLAELASFQQRGRAALRLHPAVAAGLFGPGVAVPRPLPDDAETLDDRAAVQAWLEALPNAQPAELASLLDGLRSSPARRLVVERLPAGSSQASGEYFVVSRAGRAGLTATTEDDLSSWIGSGVTLAEHLAGVEDTVARLAAALDAPEAIRDALALAARWHDAGKADIRFQRLLHGGSEYLATVEPEPLAKSRAEPRSPQAREAARSRSGYPRGARHELASTALLLSAEGVGRGAVDLDLVLHLVASHHGRCRPFAPWVSDPTPVEIQVAIDGHAARASSAHGLERFDSGVPARFWRLTERYGWWGLAWLEAVLRLADHRQSAAEQRRKEAP